MLQAHMVNLGILAGLIFLWFAIFLNLLNFHLWLLNYRSFTELASYFRVTWSTIVKVISAVLPR